MLLGAIARGSLCIGLTRLSAKNGPAAGRECPSQGLTGRVLGPTEANSYQNIKLSKSARKGRAGAIEVLLLGRIVIVRRDAFTSVRNLCFEAPTTIASGF